MSKKKKKKYNFNKTTSIRMHNMKNAMNFRQITTLDISEKLNIQMDKAQKIVDQDVFVEYEDAITLCELFDLPISWFISPIPWVDEGDGIIFYTLYDDANDTICENCGKYTRIRK